MPSPWWKENKVIIHEKVVKTFQGIDSIQIGRMARFTYLLSLYTGKVVTNLDNYMVEVTHPDLYNEESRENIIRPAVDSLTAKISTNNPRLVTQTSGGDWNLQRKAEKRTLLTEGVISDQKGYQKGRHIFRDGCIWDYGCMKVVPDYDGQKVLLERLLPHEVVVDEHDGKYMNPRCMYLIRIVPKAQLIEMYPKEATQIENAGMIRDYSAIKYQGPTEEHCAIIEAYHLPSGPKANDGRFVCCTSNTTLVDVSWKHEVFPVAVWRWKTRQIGWRGFGAVEDIENYQKQLDFLDESIGKLLNNMTVRVWAQRGSEINPDEITNDKNGFPVGTYTGEPPIIVPDPGPPEALFLERERKKAAAFEQLGISMLSAQSKKPVGLDSGVALREYKDTESERFEDVGRDWECFWVEVGELIMLALEDLNEYVPSCKIAVPTGGTLTDIKLSDIDWERDRYKIEVAPSGLLPRTPAGRLSTIKELVEVYPESVAFLADQLNNPDVEDAMSMVSAPIKYIRSDIEVMIAGTPDGGNVTPEPFINLKQAIQIVLQSYQKLRSQNAPQAILERHINYLLAAQSMLEEQAATAMAMMQGQQGQLQPGGAPPLPGPGGPPPIPGGEG